MSKYLCSVVFSILLIAAVQSGVAQSQIQNQSIEVACFEKDRMVIFENGDVKGFAVDVMDYIARQEGWQIEYLPVSLPESIQMLSTGEADLILTLGHTEERDQRFDFSEEVLLTTWGRVFTHEEADIVSILDLDGRNVGYVDDSFFYPIMQGLSRQFEIDCNFIEYGSFDSLFRSISERRIDAGLADRLKAYSLPRWFEISGDPIVFHPYGLHVTAAENDPNGYLEVIDRSLRILKDDKSSVYYSSRQKWLGEAESGGLPIWVRWIMGLVSAAAILFIIWSLSLQRQVRVRTAEIEHLRNLLSNIINSMPSVIITVDQDDRILHWNRQAEQKIGITAAEVQGQALGEVLPTFQEYSACLAQAVRTRKPVSRLRRPHVEGGITKYEDLVIYPLIDNGVRGAVIRIDDVSEKVQLEETMIQSEKMVSMGGLAAGMAHEINNPLAGIIQNASVVLQRLDGNLPVNHRVAQEAGIDFDGLQRYLEKRDVLEMLHNVIGSGKRASKIVKDMLSFARKGNLQQTRTSIPELLDTTLELARNDYKLKNEYNFKNIDIKRVYEPELPAVMCEAPKIQQVLFNVLRNGAEAMLEQPEPCFTVRARKVDGFIQIEIEDNGRGISAETKKHLFEPFYTTKEIGKGTGLGLSVSYFIISEGHGGEMNVESEPGRGACFYIRLPVRAKGEVEI